MARQLLSEEQRLVDDLNQLVGRYSPTSSWKGLTKIAIAFGMLLEIYANPNAEDSEGMCDDPQWFREYFGQIVAGQIPSDTVLIQPTTPEKAKGDKGNPSGSL